jgi:hypothetical protein
MSKYRINLWIYQRPELNDSIEKLYSELTQRMMALNSPFSWNAASVPTAPVRDKGDLAACYSVKYFDAALRHHGAYRIRDARYIDEDKTSDDTFSFEARKLSIEQYRDVLHRQFSGLIDAVGGYRAAAYLDFHSSKYSQLHQSQRRNLITQVNADPDGRNNIFTLDVAQFWDAKLCLLALGYGPDEVIKRLTGKVPLVKPLMDGVYVVFNDNPDLTFEEFCAYNDRLKPVLGLQ